MAARGIIGGLRQTRDAEVVEVGGCVGDGVVISFSMGFSIDFRSNRTIRLAAHDP